MSTPEEVPSIPVVAPVETPASAPMPAPAPMEQPSPLPTPVVEQLQPAPTQQEVIQNAPSRAPVEAPIAMAEVRSEITSHAQEFIDSGREQVQSVAAEVSLPPDEVEQVAHDLHVAERMAAIEKRAANLYGLHLNPDGRVIKTGPGYLEVVSRPQTEQEKRWEREKANPAQKVSFFQRALGRRKQAPDLNIEPEKEDPHQTWVQKALEDQRRRMAQAELELHQPQVKADLPQELKEGEKAASTVLNAIEESSASDKYQEDRKRKDEERAAERRRQEQESAERERADKEAKAKILAEEMELAKSGIWHEPRSSHKIDREGHELLQTTNHDVRRAKELELASRGEWDEGKSFFQFKFDDQKLLKDLADKNQEAKLASESELASRGEWDESSSFFRDKFGQRDVLRAQNQTARAEQERKTADAAYERELKSAEAGQWDYNTSHFGMLGDAYERRKELDRVNRDAQDFEKRFESERGEARRGSWQGSKSRYARYVAEGSPDSEGARRFRELDALNRGAALREVTRQRAGRLSSRELEGLNILGISIDDLTPELLRTKYKNFSRENHPDMAKSDPKNQEEFKKVTIMYKDLLKRIEGRANQ